MRIRLSHQPDWLRAKGYDGLWNPKGPCGCGVDDFAPCLDGPGPECVPAMQGEDDGLFYKAKRRQQTGRVA